MSLRDRLPRILKEPTGWLVIVLVAGYLYAQWPTRVKTEPVPKYYWQTLDSGFAVRWESEPTEQADGKIQVWAQRSKGVSFLVQTGELEGDFSQFVNKMAEQDQKEVAGAVQDPMQLGENWARYAFFDAESRVQTHHWYLIDNQWMKVSVLYKPSSEKRVARAEAFLGSVQR